MPASKQNTQYSISAAVAVFVVGGAAVANVSAPGNDSVTRTHAKRTKLQPMYPASALDKGQEGWATLSYVIHTDGSVIEPVVIDSSGVAAFESFAIRSAKSWRHEPATVDGEPIAQSPPPSRYTFKIQNNRGGLRREYRRFDRRIDDYLSKGQLADAENEIEKAEELGKWTIDEYSQLWFRRSELAAARGDDTAQLAALRRSVQVEGEKPDKRTARDRLPTIFVLEFQAGNYSSAIKTYDLMKKFSKKSLDDEEVVRTANALFFMVNSDQVLSTSAELDQVFNGVWFRYYEPLRREFAFDKRQGTINGFELRCEWGYYTDVAVPGKTWSIPENSGPCHLLVHGEQGTTFEYVEFAATRNDEPTGTID